MSCWVAASYFVDYVELCTEKIGAARPVAISRALLTP